MDNGSTLPGNAQTEGAQYEEKGKGKAVPDTHDVSMDEDDDEEDEDEEELETADAHTMEDDGMEEIDTSNIIAGGRRTRGKVIDFAKAAAENPADDDEEEDDEDFESNNMDED
ncbi:hypothetical protein BROUX41_005330 [Berkeleyomyces rouxiae]|uniref:uncharacterized protein n=1 Tax=Berkeleyomyces rouxiae TaxID=2035830 RepID=UPI003B80414B